MSTNATFTVPGYGARSARAVTVSHGISMIASEDRARRRKAYYITRTTSDSFTLSLVFTNWDSYFQFCQWVEGYIRRVADAANTLGPMQVNIPHLQFLRWGVPNSAVDYSDQAPSITYRLALSIEGVRNALAHTDDRLSEFRPTERGEVSRFFYPSTVELAANERSEDALYTFRRIEAESKRRPAPLRHDNPTPLREGGHF